MNVLVTGGAGFIGSNLIRFILRERPGWHIINLDVLTYSGNLENLTFCFPFHSFYQWQQGNLPPVGLFEPETD